MKKIGIIGVGVMGTDVAHAFAQAGFDVIAIDSNPNQFIKAQQKIRENVRFQKLYTKSDSSKRPDELLNRIQFSTDLSHLKGTLFIIENVTENWAVKKEVHLRLEEFTSSDTIIGINTSAIPITRIASLKRVPENVVGIHFMNPAYLMPTVEVIRGFHTSNKTIEEINKLLKNIGKKSLLVKDSPGFITNRAMMIFINEAIYSLYEGVASVEDIDILFKECFGHKMGPLQTADLIGLDTILRSLEVLYDSFKDDKYRPCVHLSQMVDAGLLGVKSGRGFYEYSR